MHTSSDIGRLVRMTRVHLGLTQENLALAAGTGDRFISELEHGKPTCELEKVLAVLNALGIRMTFTSPVSEPDQAPDTTPGHG
jgi:HTH-type transcriptional regulator / antitoxin HipB